MTCKREKTLSILVSRAFLVIAGKDGKTAGMLVSFEEEPEACQNGSI